MNSQGDINRKSNIIIYTTEDGLSLIHIYGGVYGVRGTDGREKGGVCVV